MVKKVMIIEHEIWDNGLVQITQLVGNTKEESLYAVYKNNQGEEDNVELAVHVDDMIKIRDYLNKLIEAI